MLHLAIETNNTSNEASLAWKDQADVIGFYSLMTHCAQRVGFSTVPATTLSVLHKPLTDLGCQSRVRTVLLHVECSGDCQEVYCSISQASGDSAHQSCTTGQCKADALPEVLGKPCKYDKHFDAT